VEATSLDVPIYDQELQQSETRSSAESQSRVLICAGAFVHQFSGSEIG
jgi:hypothetical protein